MGRRRPLTGATVLAPILLEGLAIADIGIPTDCSFVTFGDSSWPAAYRPSISVITDDLDARPPR